MTLGPRVRWGREPPCSLRGLGYHNNIPHQTIIPSYHIISSHIISYDIISYHIISYHIMSYHIISYHMRSYNIRSDHTIILSYHHRLLSYFVSFSHDRLFAILIQYFGRCFWRSTTYHSIADSYLNIKGTVRKLKAAKVQGSHSRYEVTPSYRNKRV